MAAVMMRIKASAFAAGGKFEGQPPHKVRYIMTGDGDKTVHVHHRAWFETRDPGMPEPLNSTAFVLHGNSPSWFETPLEFNSLPYNERRSQIAKEVERGIIEVLNSAGVVATVADIRNGTVA